MTTDFQQKAREWLDWLNSWQHPHENEIKKLADLLRSVYAEGLEDAATYLTDSSMFEGMVEGDMLATAIRNLGEEQEHPNPRP